MIGTERRTKDRGAARAPAVLTLAIVLAGLALTFWPESPGDGGEPRSAGHVSAPGAASEQLYTCGMHPQVLQKSPGSCPICKMDLTPVAADGMPVGSAAKATGGHHEGSHHEGSHHEGSHQEGNRPADAAGEVEYTCPMCPGVRESEPGSCPYCKMDLVPAPAPHSHGEPATHSELYTCGMHPDVLQTEPGSCPICKMDLTPVLVDARPAGTTASGERKIKFWRAPMDPSFVSDRPGKSPMGMDLVPVYEDEAPAGSGAVLSISPVVVQNMGVRTARVMSAPVVRTVRTVGSIDYDEARVRDVTTKFDGWIEELYASYTGQQIERGKPLFRVYSPELYSSQEEYLLALKNRHAVRSDVMPEAERDMHELADSARVRLQLFDISNAQIDALRRRGKPSKTMTILSPHSGIVVEKHARDGMQVRPGMKLYTIADLARVWVYVDVYESEVAFVKIGQDATMKLSYLPGETFHGKVIYVYPFVDTGTRTVKVRLEFDNPHLQLKPGMFADVEVGADLGRESLQVPRSAVIDTGQRRVAFVALGEGRFEPRTVRTGVDLGDDRIEILDGLAEHEEVVTSGQFLLDSESKLREAILKMVEGRSNPVPVAVSHAGHEHGEKPPGTSDGDAGVKPAAGSASTSAPAIADVLEAYFQLQEALASDEIGRAATATTALTSTLGALESNAARSHDRTEHAAFKRLQENAIEARRISRRMSGQSIDSVRALFNDLTSQIVETVRLAGAGAIDTEVYAFECPMAGGSWLQRDEEVRNPYYGFAMDGCGDPVGLFGGER